MLKRNYEIGWPTLFSEFSYAQLSEIYDVGLSAAFWGAKVNFIMVHVDSMYKDCINKFRIKISTNVKTTIYCSLL